MLKLKNFFYTLVVVIVLLIYGTQQVTQQIENFVQFGVEQGDTVIRKNDDRFEGPINLYASFPFFGRTFNSLYVCTNGLISFDRGISDNVPIRFPIRNYSVVAPFWADINTNNGGDIFYRQIVDETTLTSIANEIRRAFTEFGNFKPTFAFVVTWYQVAAYNSINSDNSKRNTFQTVLCTNGIFSFTIYNYQNLNWAKSLGGSVFAQAGSNAGDGIVYFSMPGSLTENVILLNRKSNVNITGKWIFRLEQNQIVLTTTTLTSNIKESRTTTSDIKIEKNGSTVLSIGSLVGIVFGSVISVVFLIGLGYFFYIRRTKKPALPTNDVLLE